MAEVRTVSSTGGEKGAKDARFDLIPPFVLRKLAEHYGRGALKYADHNWRRGYKWSLSIAALHRHLNAFEDGEDFDVCLGHEQDCAFVTSQGEPFEGVSGVSCYNHTGNHHMDGVNFHGFALRYFAEFLPEFDDRYNELHGKPEPEPAMENTSIKISKTFQNFGHQDVDPKEMNPVDVQVETRRLFNEERRQNPPCDCLNCKPKTKN